MAVSPHLVARLLAAPGLGDRPRAGGDHALMERIAEGDAAAFAALYDRYAGLVFALCLRVLGNRPEAEEVLGDVFWELWQRPERYDPARGSPLAYLTLLARSRATDHLRSSRRRGQILEQAHPEGLRTLLHRGSEPEDPLAESLTAETRTLLVEALKRLEPRQRQAIELSFYEALSHGEIADRLGEPLGTVKSRIRQGLIRLRESLEVYYGAGERA
jgi:RNA polymerase sigma-70 factor (ECF subfamily)